MCFNMIYTNVKGLIQLAEYNMYLKYLESPGPLKATFLFGDILEDEYFHFFWALFLYIQSKNNGNVNEDYIAFI